MTLNSARAVILLSGGLDSTTALAIARAERFECYAMSFRYGQRHHVELESAARVAKKQEVKQHGIVDIDLRQFGGSAVTGDLAIPKGRSLDEMGGDSGQLRTSSKHGVFVVCASLGRDLRGRGHQYCRQRLGLQRLPRLPTGLRSSLRDHGQSRDSRRVGRNAEVVNSHPSHQYDKSPDH